MEMQQGEIDSEKKRLVDVKNMITETLDKIRKLEADYAESKIQNQKKLTGLKKLKTSQDLRMVKLDNDIKNFETVLTSRREDFDTLTKSKVANAEELEKIKGEEADSREAFVKRLEELERSIKKGYLQLREDKEAEAILDMGLTSLKEEDRLPFVETIMKKRLESNRMRKEELDDELARIETEEKLVREELEQKQRLLADLKEEYLNLVGAYSRKKKARK